MITQRLTVALATLSFMTSCAEQDNKPLHATSASSKEAGPSAYSAMSTRAYDSYQRSSQYVPVRDGTKIAVDIFRPTNAGRVESTPLPVLFMQTQYRRSWGDGLGNEYYLPDVYGGYLELVEYGYVVVCADARGEGASFGTRRGPWSADEAMDAHDVIEWLATQPWSDGKVGMFGPSYMGGIQLLAAGTEPPHLASIFPGQTPFTQYDVQQTIVPAQGPFPESGDPSDDCLLGQCDNQTLPVDEDDADHHLLNMAIAEHRSNENPGPLPYRDSISSALGVAYYDESSPASHLDAINHAAIPVYMYCAESNWLSQGTVLNYVNLKTPNKKLLLTSPDGDFDLIAEHLRWFDYTLKGVDNGIMQEPPITYYTVGAPSGSEYRQASVWPPPQTVATTYYLDADPFGTRTLTTTTPILDGSSDDYGVVYGISNFPLDLDARGLAYTSEPLLVDTEVTGYPVVHLWVSSDAADGDFVVWLEEVDVWGNSVAVLDTLQGPGKLRASLRSLGEPPFDNLGLPWQRALQTDEQKLSGEPVELLFSTLFASHVFKAGNSIRFTVTGANADTPTLDPAPTVRIYREPRMASSIQLPVVTQQ